jgi:plastocyanin
MRLRNAGLAGAMTCALVLGMAWASAPAHAQDAKITIDNFAFTPAEITVSTGTTVSWVNRDDIPHTITDAADPREFKSSPLDTGDGFTHVFSKPGTYHYFCSLHPHMQGTVVVK